MSDAGSAGAHGEFDGRVAEVAGERCDLRYQRLRDAVLAAGPFDKKILQENNWPIPAGDDALAACGHADDVANFGNDGGEAARWDP